MTASRPPATPYYYISHALPSPADPWLRAFHCDLQDEIRRRLGPDPGYTGMLPEPRDSRPWPDDWVNTPAMRCRALVVLLTEDYYRDPRTLRDLALFRRRLVWEEDQTGRPSPALVQVLWDTRGLPAPGPEALVVPVGDYTASGLAELVRAPHARGGYLRVLRAVVERVLAGARHSPPAMTPQDLHPDPTPGESGMPHIPFSAGCTSHRQFAPVRVTWQPTHAVPPSRPEPPEREASPHRSWFSHPGDDERPILRGPHS
ncbi:hypothetical protein SAM40697_5241 [Streptomyces ambofaciens]|uniref:TIR domain-containing protein n=1 Tax=Streptomyces ambofaciens TaxID=1889 RepID=A0ABM6B5Z3_STRAM|nr:hypothetical protein [Streptomyces ambofaciens]ANB09197.1 hypothetical protein SAM40697_5241 [Streptomyces ambofaciens]